MPKFRLEVHACTECSHRLVANAETAFGYLNPPPAAGAPVLACTHILAAGRPEAPVFASTVGLAD